MATRQDQIPFLMQQPFRVPSFSPAAPANLQNIASQTSVTPRDPGQFRIDGGRGRSRGTPGGGTQSPPQPRIRPPTGSPIDPGNTGGSAPPRTPVTGGGDKEVGIPAGPQQDPFNLPQFAGPFSAPLLPQQLGALQGFEQLFGNALGAFGQVGQLQNALNQALSGDPALGGVNTALQLAQPFQIGSEGQAATQELLQNLPGQIGQFQEQLGQLAGGIPGQLGGIQQQLGQLAGGIPGQVGGITQQLQGLAGGIPSQVGGITEQLQQLAGGIPGQVGGAQNAIQQLLSGVQGIAGGPGITPETQQILSQVLPGFEQALGAERFDLGETFQAQEQLFEDALARQLGDVRAEFSGLGLGPGSGSRAEALGRAGGIAQAQFQLGQQELARQAFEDAEQRRLQALGLAPGLGGLAELGTQQQLQAAGLGGGLAGQLGQLGLGAAGLGADILGQAGQLGLAGTGLGGQLLGQAGQLGLAGTGLGANILGQQGQLGLAGTGLGGQLLGQAGQLGLGAGQLGGQLAGQLFGQEQVPVEQALRAQQQAAQRRLGALPFAFEAFNLPAQLGTQLFGLGEAGRQAADVEVQRRMQEFARTQGGGLNQLLSILQGAPQQQTAFGPSPVSQGANLLPGLIGLLGGDKE